METRDAHVPSSMRRVYYHSRGRAFPVRIIGVDGSVVTQSIQFADWESYMVNFWVRVRRRFIEVGLKWLGYKKNPAGLDEHSTKVKREKHARAYILQIFWGILLSNKS